MPGPAALPEPAGTSSFFAVPSFVHWSGLTGRRGGSGLGAEGLLPRLAGGSVFSPRTGEGAPCCPTCLHPRSPHPLHGTWPGLGLCVLAVEPGSCLVLPRFNVWLAGGGGVQCRAGPCSTLYWIRGGRSCLGGGNLDDEATVPGQRPWRVSLLPACLPSPLPQPPGWQPGTHLPLAMSI